MYKLRTGAEAPSDHVMRARHTREQRARTNTQTQFSHNHLMLSEVSAVKAMSAAATAVPPAAAMLF